MTIFGQACPTFVIATGLAARDARLGRPLKLTSFPDRPIAKSNSWWFPRQYPIFGPLGAGETFKTCFLGMLKSSVQLGVLLVLTFALPLALLAYLRVEILEGRDAWSRLAIVDCKMVAFGLILQPPLQFVTVRQALYTFGQLK